MPLKLLHTLSLGAIALSTFVPTFIQPEATALHAQTRSRSGNGTLKMVMVDQSQLSPTQRSAFQQYLQTANFPRTKVGDRCQYFGKPQVWCLLLDPNVAQQVYQNLRGQPGFGAAAEIKEVRRLREPSPKTTGI
ncbi:MAG: hypothetical protein IGS48_13850 [Oscillatoriales cyanobacterium C42_A2020_001]|nr:hypothetical protein [Leptolyngbyaceae cyanobacterium C42_A2020_001]